MHSRGSMGVGVPGCPHPESCHASLSVARHALLLEPVSTKIAERSQGTTLLAVVLVWIEDGRCKMPIEENGGAFHSWPCSSDRPHCQRGRDQHRGGAHKKPAHPEPPWDASQQVGLASGSARSRRPGCGPRVIASRSWVRRRWAGDVAEMQTARPCGSLRPGIGPGRPAAPPGTLGTEAGARGARFCRSQPFVRGRRSSRTCCGTRRCPCPSRPGRRRRYRLRSRCSS